MPGLLIMYALGHKGTKAPHELESLVAAGHGYYAHAGNQPQTASKVIDEAQHVESAVTKEGAQLPEVITARVPKITTSVSHTWTTTEIQISHLLQQVIPQQNGWF